MILAGALLLVFYDVFLLQKSFISGDHRVQHYPWAHFLQSELRLGRFPWWTSLVQCGFPIFAEGQMGALYPLHWVFLLFLPIRAAYSYEILFHFFLGGLFFFWHVRSFRLSFSAAAFATLVYIFGSSHAGFSYNATSQRVLIWFPLALFLVDRLVKRPRFVTTLGLGAVMALEILAGYQQFAVYAVGFTGLYLLGRLSWREEEKRRPFSVGAKIAALFLAALGISLLLTLPQWIAFLELSRFSSRLELGEAFAYVGSMNPLGLLALLFPRWGGFLTSKLYVGVIALYLIGVSFLTKKTAAEKLNWALLIIAFLLALGGFSPLYIGLVNATHFYGFRIPSKFLYFASFFLATLAGFGFQKCFDLLAKGKEEILSGARNLFYALMAFGAGALLVGNVTLHVAREPVQHWLRSYIEHHIVGTPGHPHSPEVYLAKLESFYETALWNSSLKNPWVLAAIATILASVFLVRSLSWRIFRGNLGRILLSLFLFADLYAYGFNSIKGDYESFSFAEEPDSQIVKHLTGNAANYRIYEFDPDLKAKERFPIAANLNMINRINDIGVYSPLAFRQYKELLQGLGAADDSLFSYAPKEDALETNREWLNFLAVKYIVSSRAINVADLELLLREGDLYLYENKKAFPRAFFVRSLDRMEQELSSSGSVSYRPVGKWMDHQQAIEVEGDFPSKGYVVLSDLDYPGWKAWVNGENSGIRRVRGLFRAVRVGRGKNRIKMVYRPRHLYAAGGVSLLSFFLLVFYGVKELRTCK